MLESHLYSDPTLDMMEARNQQRLHRLGWIEADLVTLGTLNSWDMAVGLQHQRNSVDVVVILLHQCNSVVL
jgi:hypothetical protein